MFKDELRKYLLFNGARLNHEFETASDHDVVSNLNAYVNDFFFNYEVREEVVSSYSELPNEFFWKKKGEIFFCKVTNKGTFVNRRELVENIFEDFKNINIFYIVKSIKIMSGRGFYISLVKTIPKHSIISVFFVFFSLLSPFYVNLFNSNLIYNDSLISVLYVTFIFILLLGFEVAFKRLSSNYLLSKMKITSMKVSSYLGYILGQSKVSNISTKLRVVESSAYSSLEIFTYIIPDLILIVVYSCVLVLLLGTFSFILAMFYVLSFIIMMVIRFKFYNKMLKANPATYDRINRITSLNNRSADLRFINESRLDSFLETKNEDDEINKLYLSKHNFLWSEIGKAGSFIATIVMFMASYVSIQNGSLQIASVMGILIVNSRLYSSLIGLVGRLYQLLLHKEYIEKYVDDMFEGYIINNSSLSVGAIEKYCFRGLKLVADDTVIFSDVSMSLAKGNTLGIFGSVGSGKTSLLNVLSNIEKRYMGSVEINNVDIKNLSSNYIRKKIAFYNSNTNFIYGTLKDNFSFFGVVSNDDIVKILTFSCPKLPITYETLELMLVENLPISNGEKQRMLILILLNKKPDLILLDEPTSFLSESEGFDFIRFIRLTNPFSVICLATHDIALKNICTHQISMD